MVEARIARFLCAPLALALASCVSFELRRELAERAVEEEGLAELEVGATDLEQVLARFGAPLRVLELDGEAALAYGWLRAKQWGFGVSVPLGDASGSFDYASIDRRMRGVLFLFDERWVLQGWREGALTDLLLDAGRVRPSLPPSAAP